MGDESVGYSGFASVVSATTEEGFVIFDTRIRDYVSAHEPEFVELVKIGGVIQADTVDEVARHIGASADEVAATLSEYDQAARGMREDLYGRTESGMARLRPPTA